MVAVVLLSLSALALLVFLVRRIPPEDCCSVCGVSFPISDGMEYEGRPYCSAACWRCRPAIHRKQAAPPVLGKPWWRQR